MTKPILRNNKVGPLRGAANQNATDYWDRIFTIEEFALLAHCPISMLKKAALENGLINGKSTPPIHSISSGGKIGFRGADVSYKIK